MSTNYFVPTGTIIKQYLDENSISQKELSKRTGISEKHISNLLNGNSRLTEEVALKLELIFKDIPASYWLNLETKYREHLAREVAEQRISEENLNEISKRFKFKEVFKGLKWSLAKQAVEMLKLLKISDFDNFANSYSNLDINFFEDGGEIEPIAIWLNLCQEEIEIQNDDIDSTIFSQKELEKSLAMFKNISNNKDIPQSLSSCRKLCNKLGIYLVVREPITNCKVRGALTTYKNHPTIFISGRFKTHDHIWFAFIHEIAHLIKHYSTKDILISFENEVKETNIREEEANAFARDFFINPIEYNDFVEKKDYSKAAINNFAASQNTTPGILIARLQHDEKIDRDKFNYKK